LIPADELKVTLATIDESPGTKRKSGKELTFIT
jgi:hypothetical protein